MATHTHTRTHAHKHAHAHTVNSRACVRTRANAHTLSRARGRTARLDTPRGHGPMLSPPTLTTSPSPTSCVTAAALSPLPPTTSMPGHKRTCPRPRPGVRPSTATGTTARGREGQRGASGRGGYHVRVAARVVPVAVRCEHVGQPDALARGCRNDLVRLRRVYRSSLPTRAGSGVSARARQTRAPSSTRGRRAARSLIRPPTRAPTGSWTCIMHHRPSCSPRRQRGTHSCPRGRARSRRGVRASQAGVQLRRSSPAPPAPRAGARAAASCRGPPLRLRYSRQKKIKKKNMKKEVHTNGSLVDENRNGA
jgi:hypothetical protein